jgi:peroxiredoxin family protein/TusA-related sulfurtransferase
MKTNTLDTTGMMCPGPLLKLREAMDGMDDGDCLEMKASDPGFARDVQAFCNSAGHTLLGIEKEHGVLKARVKKGTVAGGTACVAAGGAAVPAAPRSGATLVCFSGELDKAMAAFIIATGAAAMGGQATIFFTFWGLNVLRRDPAPAVDKDLMGKMFGMMMPRGADKLPLSNMHMGGMGTTMMKYRMASKNLPSLPGLIADARKAGVRMLACAMSMDAMGLTLGELVEGVEVGGVADMLDCSANSATSMFI